ncbi:MAG: 50S ribosomal protein L6 [Candidatus Sumerlaeota bacterium]|nr:50S ribosomal protein L6 [Candidatus Sumerlaeota bacterium]
MSRVGKVPIKVPSGVDVKVEGLAVSVKGPKGSLTMRIPDTRIAIERESGQLLVRRASEDKKAHAYQGLVNRLVSNMITGVTQGFAKQLELRGVGYRATMDGGKLSLALGYSHPILFDPPQGIAIVVEKNQTNITISGIDKQLVGQVAANIRSMRPPEPYKGKGVRYVGEYVRQLEGKKAAKA